MAGTDFDPISRAIVDAPLAANNQTSIGKSPIVKLQNHDVAETQQHEHPTAVKDAPSFIDKHGGSILKFTGYAITGVGLVGAAALFPLTVTGTILGVTAEQAAKSMGILKGKEEHIFTATATICSLGSMGLFLGGMELVKYGEKKEMKFKSKLNEEEEAAIEELEELEEKKVSQAEDKRAVSPKDERTVLAKLSDFHLEIIHIDQELDKLASLKQKAAANQGGSNINQPIPEENKLSSLEKREKELKAKQEDLRIQKGIYQILQKYMFDPISEQISALKAELDNNTDKIELIQREDDDLTQEEAAALNKKIVIALENKIKELENNPN